ncbi:SANT/Myb_domain [Hexamita inflata]|uniref:SANT/Myb domain n=1 Tax=Hexamita inflata TaxID=28002 RepID=A0AA86UA80_9EUKA|nr:SANT/Myb domain [Hexamita inflata]
MIRIEAVEQLILNLLLLQQIHQCTHEIKRNQKLSYRVQRDRWSKEEDSFLFDAVQIIGNHNYNAIAALIGSKTASQVYQRLRYLRDTLDSFAPEVDQNSDILQ